MAELSPNPRSLALAKKILLMEQFAYVSRLPVPERMMHANGSGAYGTFTVTNNISQYTKAGLFAKVGNTAPVFVRFSTGAGQSGAADAERDLRGFALRFMTAEGDWELVGSSMPIFFLNNPLKVPMLGGALGRGQDSNLRNANDTWGFWTQSPETLHLVTMLMSDRGIPASYRHMHGYGCHTFSLINAAGGRFWVKFHLRTNQGIQCLTDENAAVLIGQDRKSHHRDLYENIAAGNFPSWTLYIQLIPEDSIALGDFNPFDVTKVWYKSDYPLIPIGTLELNRNPADYHEEVEKAAFNPARIIPGIGFSPDPVLLGRLMVYSDAARYRVAGSKPLPDLTEALGEWPETEFDRDYYTQPGRLFQTLDAAARQRLFDNTARAMAGVQKSIKQAHIENCTKAHPDYGRGLAAALLPN